MTSLTKLFRSLLTWGVDEPAPRGTEPTNAAGQAMPTFDRKADQPVKLTRVDHPDGRSSQYPPSDRWEDWTEYDGKSWPERVPRNYSLVPTICFNCESACGLLAYVDKTTYEVKKFEGNPVHPGSRGRNCAKGPATHNQTYDPERILHPLKRVGARGEGKWQRVSWNDALADIGARMRESRQRRRDGIMYHVGRPGDDHYANRAITAPSAPFDGMPYLARPSSDSRVARRLSSFITSRRASAPSRGFPPMGSVAVELM